MDAFGKVVDYGLRGDRLAVKFLFKPGSTQFASERSIRAPYGSWLETIAERTSAKQGCLEVLGHTSATGLPAVNDRRSGLRADYIKDRLESEQGSLRGRLVATGEGSREMIVGTAGRCQRLPRPPRRAQGHAVQRQRQLDVSWFCCVKSI